MTELPRREQAAEAKEEAFVKKIQETTAKNQALADKEKALQQSRLDQARAEFVAYSFQLDAARQLIERGRPDDALAQLRLCDPKRRGWEHEYLTRQCRKLLWTGRHGGTVTCLVLSSDGERVASGDQDGTVKVWKAATGQRS